MGVLSQNIPGRNGHQCYDKFIFLQKKEAAQNSSENSSSSINQIIKPKLQISLFNKFTVPAIVIEEDLVEEIRQKIHQNDLLTTIDILY